MRTEFLQVLFHFLSRINCTRQSSPSFSFVCTELSRAFISFWWFRFAFYYAWLASFHGNQYQNQFYDTQIKRLYIIASWTTWQVWIYYWLFLMAKWWYTRSGLRGWQSTRFDNMRKKRKICSVQYQTHVGIGDIKKKCIVMLITIIISNFYFILNYLLL